MSSRNDKSVANIIKSERRAQKKTQTEMGKLLNITRRQYQRIEGTRRMRVDDLIAICKILDLEFSVVKVQKEIKLI